MHLAARTSFTLLTFCVLSFSALQAEVYSIPPVDDGSVEKDTGITIIVDGVPSPPGDYLYNGKDGLSTDPFVAQLQTTLRTLHRKQMGELGYRGMQYLSLLEFDLSSIPAGDQIVSARLELQYKYIYRDLETTVNLFAYQGDGVVALSDLELASVPLASGVMVNLAGLTDTEVQALSGNVYSLPLDVSTLTAYHQAGSVLGVRMAPEEFIDVQEGRNSFSATSVEDTSPGAIGPKLIIETISTSQPLVEIDVQVGSARNSVTLGGFLSFFNLMNVGVKSNDTFDATTINHSSVKLGDPVLVSGSSAVGTPVGPSFQFAFDFDYDGDDDVLYFFNVNTMRRRNAISIDSEELILTGSTTSGHEFEATDSVDVTRSRNRWF